MDQCHPTTLTSLLHVACSPGNVEIASILIQNGADVNAEDDVSYELIIILLVNTILIHVFPVVTLDSTVLLLKSSCMLLNKCWHWHISIGARIWSQSK